jgi:hypothetical protein
VETKTKQMKILKIDVVAKTVTEIEIENNLADIYSAIGNGCNLFCVPVTFDNGDALYADDEALLQENVQGAFIMDDWESPIVGNALIVGTDSEGDSISCKTTVNDLFSKITFLDSDVAEKRREEVINSPKMIIFF